MEKVAARRSLLLAVSLPAFLLTVAWVPFPWAEAVGRVVLAVAMVGGLALLSPTGTPRGFVRAVPASRVDERTVMFARAELEPGTDRFNRYYEQFPQHRRADDRFRKLPGLMSVQSGKYERLTFAAAEASFATVARLADLKTGRPATAAERADPETVTEFLKGWAVKLGAHTSGVAELKEYHFYTVKGRGPDYGKPVRPVQGFALAFTVEMDHRNLGSSPEGPTLMESAQQYLNAGAIAVQVALFLRKLGFTAEAHIDGNYQVICPLVCRDAGLGEIGRMGLLMTPSLGPRVRLAVVTTDFPLIPDKPTFDPAVLDFCSVCRKCADVCPVQAIPAGAPVPIDGAFRWKLDSEACFTYWCAVGTDCGQCMKVCPYSHPDSLLHNLVRRGLGRSALFRRFALRMDDFLYGRRPTALPSPRWVPIRKAPR